ncbi:hypothetical protein CLAFUW4_10131 [Fulvia fulva]|nr:hypothetical protein CLAFUW4_10131 [Fulvia fulva]
MEEKKWYKHCRQGEAFFETFPIELVCHDGRKRELCTIGTSGCRTCVCIYVRLSDDSCFIAHIAAETGTEDEVEKWRPDEEQGALLSQAIEKRLRSHSQLTILVNAKDYKLQKGEYAVCSCHSDTFKGKPSVGKYIIQGLHDFFGKMEVRKACGFIVDHAKRDIDWLTTTAEASREAIPSDHGWHSQKEDDYVIEEGMGSEDWHFVWIYEEGDWVRQDEAVKGHGTHRLESRTGEQWYKHCKQGQSFVLNLPLALQCHDGNTHTVDTVGTAKCFTCVGLYVRLSDTSCFVAHIAADLHPFVDDTGLFEPWRLDEKQGELLKKAVIRKLETVDELRGFRAPNHKFAKGDIAICCEHRKEAWGLTMVGDDIIDGLRAFFGDDIPVRHAQGFLAQPHTRDIQFFRGKPKEYVNWEWCLENKLKYNDIGQELPSDWGWDSQSGEDDLSIADGSDDREWHFWMYDGDWISGD